MKDYIVENKDILSTNETIKLTNLVNEHSNKIADIENKLEIVMDNFIDPNTYKHFLIKDGEKIEADIAYQSIYRLAKDSIYIMWIIKSIAILYYSKTAMLFFIIL